MGVGIIGGADGPTVMIVSSVWDWIYLIAGAILLCTAVGLIIWKMIRNTKSNDIDNN